MTKLAIVDLDGVIIDNTKRMEVAETKREFYRQHLGDCLPDALASPINHASVQKGFDDLLENLYWQTAFNPGLVKLDTLMEGAVEALVALEWQYRVIYLTSRPESLRNATNTWLYQHQVYSTVNSADRLMVMKDSAFKYTKTVVWKVGIVQTLHRLYGADAIMVIDDSPDIRQGVLDAYPEGGDFGLVQVAASLDEAVKLVVKR
jgi:hypothetical protein